MFFINCLFFALFSPATDQILYPGQSVHIAARPGVPVHIDSKSILQVSDAGNKLEVVGKKTGHANIHVGSQVHGITVVKRDLFETYQKLKIWLQDKEGPTIAVEGGQIYIRGTFLTFIDWRDLGDTMSGSDTFTIQAGLAPGIKEKINQYLREMSETNNLPYSDLTTLPNWEISIGNQVKENIPVYKKIFSPYGIKVNHSSYTLSSLPMIEIAISAAEVKRSELSKIGVQWPASTPFQLLPEVGLNPQSLMVALDHLEQKGWGKTLASPKLLTQSGEEATFHSGGEFPIKISNQFNAGVTWKKYGIMLKIKPKADFTGKISVQIECEVSAIDGSQVIDGVPGLLINKISSHFNLSESKTIALSGLIKEEWGNSRQGLPGLSDIPILKSLFSSESYRNNQSELLFFVTPRIVR